MKAPTYEETLRIAKCQILADIQAGAIPKDIKTFWDLDDYRDANTYGNLCEDDTFDALVDHFGGRDKEDEGMPQGMVDFVNKLHEELDAWMLAGRPE